MNRRITITVIFALVLLICVWAIRSGVGALDELDDLLDPEKLIISVFMFGALAFWLILDMILGMFGFHLPGLPFIVLSGGIGTVSAFSGIKIVNMIKTPPSSLLVNIILIVTVIINIILFYHIIGEKK